MSSEGNKDVQTESGVQATAPKDPFQKPLAVAEKNEEAKLRAKYPNLVRGGGGGSTFLHKRLSRGQKYFDSGDYNMAKQNKRPLPQSQGLLLPGAEAEVIPTPEEMPQRKPSLIQSKLATLS